VAYLSVDGINAWLASTKYTAANLDTELEQGVIDWGFGKLSTRYATDTWIDDSTTPGRVLTGLEMLYAAWFLQRQVSDDDGMPDYALHLEKRAMDYLCGIADDIIDLPGVDPDPDLIKRRAPVFFPTDSSTQLAEDDPHDPNGSPRAFSMSSLF
jgi:hypothetical protein